MTVITGTMMCIQVQVEHENSARDSVPAGCPRLTGRTVSAYGIGKEGHKSSGPPTCNSRVLMTRKKYSERKAKLEPEPEDRNMQFKPHFKRNAIEWDCMEC